MGRSPCCDDANLKKGPWTPEEDDKLAEYIKKNGHGNWRNLPKKAGLNRCGKSCRLRWTNYLRPDIKRGEFTEDEERLIIHLHSVLGNKWSAIASRLPKRTDNEIKNYWNTRLRKKLLLMGIDPVTHQRRTDLDILASVQFTNLNSLAEAAQLAKLQLLQKLVQVISCSSASANMNAMNLLGSPSSRNNQFGDLLQFNRQLEGLVNGSIGLVQDPIQASLGFPSMAQMCSNHQTSSTPSLHNQSQEMVAKMNNSCSSEIAKDHMFGPFDMPTAISTPSLVSASSDMTVMDQVHQSSNSNDVSANSSPFTTTFDAHEGFNLDDLDSDLSWKDILDHISWSDEL